MSGVPYILGNIFYYFSCDKVFTSNILTLIPEQTVQSLNRMLLKQTVQMLIRLLLGNTLFAKSLSFVRQSFSGKSTGSDIKTEKCISENFGVSKYPNVYMSICPTKTNTLLYIFFGQIFIFILFDKHRRFIDLI